MENKDFEIEQESLDMNNMALSNVTKYLATYKNPKEWILDEKEAKAARVLKSVAPEKSSKVGSLPYSAGEVLRTTAALPRQFVGSVDLLSSALKDRFYPNAEESALQRWANNYGKLEAQREETSQELISQEVGDIDWYTWGAAGGQLIRDIALTGGIAKLGAKVATKAAEKRLAGTLAGEEVAQRYTRLMAREGAKKAGSAAITGSVFAQEVGSRTVDDINQYIARTGDADLKYYDPSVDLAVNIGVGALSSQIEKGLGVERFVPRLIARGAGEKIPGLTQILARGAEGMAGESLEEGAQETAGQIGEMIKGYRDWWDFDTDQILTSMTIGGVLGGTAGAGLYYINRRTAINRLVNEGMDKNLAADLVDTIASREINKTINNLSAATELNTKNGEAYDKLKAGIKRALELQGWSEKMIDSKTDAELSIDEYVDLTVNSQIINTAVREAFNSGITIDEFLDVAQFTAVDNFMVLRPLGTTEEINARIDEQKAIIARQQDLKKTGAGDNTILREAKMKKAILEKVRLNKIVNDEIQKVNLEEAKTPENFKEIETADKDVEALKTAPTASDFNASLDNNLTTAQKTKRLGNAVLKKIFGSDKVGFDSVITLPEYTNAKTALTNSAERIINFAKKHRTYGIQTDLRNALNLMRTVNQGNFLEHATTPSLDGTDVIAQNAFLYHFLFKDADTTSAFIDAYLERAEASISGETDTKLTKKDLVGQAFKATDNLMQVQAESAGIEYNSIYNEDGSYKDQNVAAVMMSYQNQFAKEQEMDYSLPFFDGKITTYDKNGKIKKDVLEKMYSLFSTEQLDKVIGFNGETLREMLAKSFGTVEKNLGLKASATSDMIVGMAERAGGVEPIQMYNAVRISRGLEPISEQKMLFHTDIYDGLATTNSIGSVLNKLQFLNGGQAERMLYDTQSKNWYLADADETTHGAMFEKAFEQGNYPQFNSKREANQFFEENYISDEQTLLSFLAQKFDTPEITKTVMEKTLGLDEYTNAYLRDNLVIYARYESDLSESGFPVESFEHYKIEYDEDNNKKISLIPQETKSTLLAQAKQANGFFDPELNVVLLGKNWNTMTLPHELAHYWLNTLFNVYKRVQSGGLKANAEWIQEKKDMFAMLGIDENQDALTAGQQEKFARMTEAYLTGIGVSKEMSQTFKDFFAWVPEKYKSILQLGYLDDQGKLQYPFLDQKAVDFFNRWYENASLPSLPTSPERQRFMNVTDGDGEPEKVSIKEMNDREKEFAQDAEEQQRTDARLYNTLDENMPADIKPVADAQKVVIDERSNFLKESQAEQVQVAEEPKRRWFERKSRETEIQKAQEYIEKNLEHAKEVIFGDPELVPNDTGVDRATLINTYMALNNITPENPDWATLHTNIAINQSLAGTQLALSNDKSYGTYLDALREVENALELKAATNYAGSKQGARERFNADIQRFLDRELPAIFATQPNSKEREVALRAMFEKARTTFSGNTTGSFLNQVDLDYAKGQTKKTEAFMRWAINQIKKDAGAKLNNEQQAKLLQISAKAQQAMEDLDNRDAGKAVAAAQELRNWQMEKQALMGISPQKFSLFGDYAPRAMLASFNTLVVANIPSTAINTVVVNATKTGLFGKNEVSKDLIDSEVKRIKAIYGATGMNLAQMEKPTSPSLLHGEKYSATGQKWYDPYTILGKEDNFFRVPTFVNTLAQIASTDAKATGRSADDVFREYASINNQTDEAKLARKQALAVANMAVFTQNGALANCLNHIRSELNKLSRVTLGLEPEGFGLGNLIAPFLTTGANIAEMGIRGSLAPITTITTMVNKWRTGKALDPMKKLALRMDWTYFTMSAVSMVLLAALTSDDDDFYTDPYRTGIKYSPDKPYDSINLAGVWLDLDFFGPFSIPMRTAAKVIQAWKKDNGIESVAKGYAESAKSVLGDIPLAESIINNQVNWAVKKPGSWASSYLYTQANKLVPAQLKPISRAVSRGEDWIFEPFEGTTVGRKFNRNYGFDGVELTTQDLIELFTIKVQLDQSLNTNL